MQLSLCPVLSWLSRLIPSPAGWPWLVLGVLAALPLRAQDAADPTRWQADPVLSSLLIQQLVPDKVGYLWVATDDGVRRYDGYAAVPLTQLVRGGAAAPHGYVTLALDRAGRLWIGAESGLYWFAPATGRLTAVALPTAPAERPLVSALWLDNRTGQLWVGYGDARLLVFDPNRPRALPAAAPASLTQGEVVRTFVTGSNGHVWLISKDLLLLDGRGRLVRRLPRPAAQLLPVAGTRPLQLVGSHALYEMDSLTGALRERLRWLAGASLMDDRFTPYPDARGQPSDWIIQGQRIRLRWDAGNALPRVTREPVAFAGLDASQAIYRLYWVSRDGAGNWWASTPGLRSCYKAGPPAPVQRLPLPPVTGIPSVRSLGRLPDGRLLVGSYAGTFTQAADSPRAPLRHWLLTRAGVPWPGPFYHALTTRAGHTLFGGEQTSFGEVNPRTGVITEFAMTPGSPAAGLVHARTLYQDRRGRIWGGALTGLYQLDEDRQRVTRYRATDAAWPLHQREVRSISEDAAGTLWLATDQGLYALNSTTDALRHYGPGEPTISRRLPTANVMCVLANGPGGQVWLGTRDAGLLALDARRGVVRQLTVAQGMPDAPVATLLPGANGVVWAGTYAGLVRYVSATDQLSVYGPTDGLTETELNQQAAFRDSNEALYFGGVGGAFRVVGTPLPVRPAAAPKLLFTATTSGDSAVRWLLGSAAPSRLYLAGSTTDAGVNLALTDFRAPERTRFSYRLWPADADPAASPPVQTTTHQLRLRGLAAGDYSLEVWGQTIDGHRSAARRVAVTVARPWWQHPLALLGAAVLLLGAGAALQYVRLQRHLREARLRTRIAADLHDDVGSLLTQISMESTLLQEGVYPADQQQARLGKVAATSREAARHMSDVVWSIDARNDSFVSVLDRLRDHAHEVLPPAGVELGFSTDSALRDLPFAPAHRQNLYFIFKEALHNVVKHAGAHLVTVRLTRVGHRVRLEVRDDGRGATAPPGAASHGLRNMQMRAEAVGGWVTYETHAPGFAVIAELPMS